LKPGMPAQVLAPKKHRRIPYSLTVTELA
jgi:hypothetical protein